MGSLPTLQPLPSIEGMAMVGRVMVPNLRKQYTFTISTLIAGSLSSCGQLCWQVTFFSENWERITYMGMSLQCAL